VATNTGIPSNAATDAGQFPYDTATAAVNIARNPAGGGTATQRSAYMSTIYSLPTGNVPFTPNLVSTGAGQPNDFMVAIKYPQSGTPTANSFIQSPESIASDGYGNVWFDNNPASGSGHSVVQFSPLGLVSHDFSYGTTIATYVSIDPGSNAWVGTGQTVAEASGVVTEFNEVGTALNGTVVPSTGMKPTGGHFALGYADATDGLDNYYIGDANLGTGYRISEISWRREQHQIRYSDANMLRGADYGQDDRPCGGRQRGQWLQSLDDRSDRRCGLQDDDGYDSGCRNGLSCVGDES
jgi:hypothetical protein